MDKPKPSVLSSELHDAVETLIRRANKDGFVAIGVVFNKDNITLLRNTKDDPVELLHLVAEMIQMKVENGLVEERKVGEVN